MLPQSLVFGSYFQCSEALLDEFLNDSLPTVDFISRHLNDKDCSIALFLVYDLLRILGKLLYTVTYANVMRLGINFWSIVKFEADDVLQAIKNLRPHTRLTLARSVPLVEKLVATVDGILEGPSYTTFVADCLSFLLTEFPRLCNGEIRLVSAARLVSLRILHARYKQIFDGFQLFCLAIHFLRLIRLSHL